MTNKSIYIKNESLSVDAAYQYILDERSGGNCIFVGSIRDLNMKKTVRSIDFDCYDAMALKEMHKIADELFSAYEITRILMHHRKGLVKIKDIAVIIAVSAIHRDAAFAACRTAIDALKKRVPIWKKEFYQDGHYWINSTP